MHKIERLSSRGKPWVKLALNSAFVMNCRQRTQSWILTPWSPFLLISAAPSHIHALYGSPLQDCKNLLIDRGWPELFFSNSIFLSYTWKGILEFNFKFEPVVTKNEGKHIAVLESIWKFWCPQSAYILKSTDWENKQIWYLHILSFHLKLWKTFFGCNDLNGEDVFVRSVF